MFDATATAYDRRTGERVAEAVIKASEECPVFAMVSKQDNVVKNTVDAKSVVAWARSALAKGPSAPGQGAQRGNAEPSTANQLSH